ncbi:MAG TPA: sigma 54-interacting transcriptional regulator [Polyangia bacterium]|jgi:transcriptional regulator with AAA-type ATPase domain
MAADRGATTVTGVGSQRAARSEQELRLAWVFPRAGTASLDPGRQADAGISIGRDETCAIRLEGNDISRRHAVVERPRPDGPLTLRDLGSRNGVRVNGNQVQVAAIDRDDVVRLGGWVGVVTTAVGGFTELAPGLLGGGTLQEALAPLTRAAPSDLPIVLEGETGTGKEVVARTIHSWSDRGGPMVAVNCGALPEGLAEAELFGYRRGAFTGADRASVGFFRSAEGGTLLLDEVSDLPLGVQAKLLRVLEERAVQPLGETRPVPVDVRIIVAGQQPLMESVREGRFRADLLARVDGVTVRLPPLRRRREDVLPLFSSLLGKLGQGQVPAIESDLAERLCLHDWPFNVRELVFLVRRLLTLHARESTLRAEHLPERIGVVGGQAGESNRASRGPGAGASGEPVELPALLGALRTSGGNVARAAAILGITRQRAYRLMEGQSIDLEALRNPEPEPRKQPPPTEPKDLP